MIPTKNASSDMNNAESPRNETTRHSALATGFRLRTTAAAKITVSTAKIQNRNGDIIFDFDFRFSNFYFGRSLFLVPFQYHAVHYSADLEEFFLVMDHVGAREASDGVIFAQKNRLLRANFLAHPAVNAANHVDLEEFFLVMDHVGAREASDGVIFAQKNRLLRANFLAHPAVNAANHVDIE